MHELSIAQSIVQLSEQQAREHHSSQIEEVELEKGVLPEYSCKHWSLRWKVQLKALCLKKRR